MHPILKSAPNSKTRWAAAALVVSAIALMSPWANAAWWETWGDADSINYWYGDYADSNPPWRTFSLWTVNPRGEVDSLLETNPLRVGVYSARNGARVTVSRDDNVQMQLWADSSVPGTVSIIKALEPFLSRAKSAHFEIYTKPYLICSTGTSRGAGVYTPARRVALSSVFNCPGSWGVVRESDGAYTSSLAL